MHAHVPVFHMLVTFLTAHTLPPILGMNRFALREGIGGSTNDTVALTNRPCRARYAILLGRTGRVFPSDGHQTSIRSNR